MTNPARHTSCEVSQNIKQSIQQSRNVECDWCSQTSKTNSYILPIKNGKKVFCSQDCLLEFRKNTCCSCWVESISEQFQIDLKNVKNGFCSEACLQEFRRGNENSSKEKTKSKSTLSCTLFSSSTTIPFLWDDYLKETKSTAAPVFCFKQNLIPYSNEFTPGLKLEAEDPRNTTSICVATIIAIIGPRLRLRLDGSDNKSDFWRLIDSSKIHPIGHCENTGSMLQPPLGFRSSAFSWLPFLVKTLNGSNAASPIFFKTEPPSPSYNMFRVGHKIEAVDLKNPQLICAATVGAVRGNSIHVTFDGWKGAFDYWCRFDSRDIFPVGWCDINGHPLQPPGYTRQRIVSPTSSVSKPRVTPIGGLLGIATEPDTSSDNDSPVTVYISNSCNCGTHLIRSKIRKLPIIFGPGPMKKVAKEVIQSLIDASKSTKDVFTLLQNRQGQGDVCIRAKLDHQKHKLNLPLLHNSRDLAMFLELVSEDLGCCNKLISTVSDVNCLQCRPVSVPLKRQSSEEEKLPKSQRSKKKRKLEMPDLALSPPITPPNAIHVRDSTSPDLSNSSFAPIECSQMSSRPPEPTDWSVEDVTCYLNSIDSGLKDQICVFQQHEIDGQALLLLNSDVMMKYMGIKLGPALKLCKVIGALKK